MDVDSDLGKAPATKPVTAPAFDEKSISSIGGRGKNNPAWLLKQIRAELAARADDLSTVMTATGFGTKSLSSMLNGAGKDLAAGIDALVTHRQALGEIITDGPFDAKSLSSMLAGAGKDLAAGIDALVTHRQALEEIITDGPFDAKSLSSMLHGAGKDLAAGIDAVQSRLPKLQALCTIFRPTQIATRLYSVPTKKLGTTIDRMHAIYSAELAGNTVLPPGAMSKILNASPAALQSGQHIGG
jgi:hypothetical protein